MPPTLRFLPLGSVPPRLPGSGGLLERRPLEAGPDERRDASRLLPPRAVDDDRVQAPETLPSQQGDEGLRAEEGVRVPPRKGLGIFPPQRSTPNPASRRQIRFLRTRPRPYLIPVPVHRDREAQVRGHGGGAHRYPFLCRDAEVLGHVPCRGQGGGRRQPQEAAHAQAIPENLPRGGKKRGARRPSSPRRVPSPRDALPASPRTLQSRR